MKKFEQLKKERDRFTHYINKTHEKDFRVKTITVPSLKKFDTKIMRTKKIFRSNASFTYHDNN